MQSNRNLTPTEANALKFLLETFSYDSFVRETHLSNEIMTSLCEKGYLIFEGVTGETAKVYVWKHSDEANIEYKKKINLN